jgi:hypothetical protein
MPVSSFIQSALASGVSPSALVRGGGIAPNVLGRGPSPTVPTVPTRPTTFEKTQLPTTTQTTTITTTSFSWNDMLFELMRFRANNGHCVVPRTLPALHAWVCEQRRQKKIADLEAAEYQKRQGFKGEVNPLTLERIKVLESIDFEWAESHHEVWYRYYDQFFEFKLQSGHCNVPIHTALGRWVRLPFLQKKE